MLNNIASEKQSNLRHALEILDLGGVVGIPTETVYGLAARLDRPEGLKQIFSVKQRPFFDPLIVHVNSIAMAQKYVTDWNEVCTALAAEFWPGPLSLVLEKSEAIPEIVTAGLNTVAVRMPRSEPTLELIRQAGVGLAAPSANRFGKTSPTSSAHVASEFGDAVFVVPDCKSEIGIESTVLRVRGSILTILRPGVVTPTAINKALAKKGLQISWNHVVDQVESPGQMKHHYMPDIPLVLTDALTSPPDIRAYVVEHAHEIPDQIYGVNVAKVSDFATAKELILSHDPLIAAREFYGKLREAAESRTDFIFFRVHPDMEGEIWAAIFDRLKKAASLSTLSPRSWLTMDLPKQ